MKYKKIRTVFYQQLNFKKMFTWQIYKVLIVESWNQLSNNSIQKYKFCKFTSSMFELNNTAKIVRYHWRIQKKSSKQFESLLNGHNIILDRVLTVMYLMPKERQYYLWYFWKFCKFPSNTQQIPKFNNSGIITVIWLAFLKKL